MAQSNEWPVRFEREELKRHYDASHPAYEEALSTMHRQVRSLLESRGYTPTIKYRVKRFAPYYDKLQKVLRGEKGGEEGLITDLLGLRIICPFLEDMEIIETLLGEQFEVVELQRKGAQNSFREFGYDSVHMLIKLGDATVGTPLPSTAKVCEIQLRTILQDAWAEVEHELVYKSDIALPNESVKRKLAALNANLTLSDLIFQELRDYQKEVRSRDRRRRESIEECLLSHNLISISHSAGRTLPESPESRVIATASDLERTMLSALNAHSQNDLPAAIGLYGKLLEMELEDKVRALVYNHRGMAYFSLEDYEQALRDFSESIRHDDSSSRNWANRGLVKRVQQQFEESVEDYTRALDIDPASPVIYFGRAQTFSEMRLYSRALADCNQALALQPDYAPARHLSRLIRKGVFSRGK